MQGKHNEDLNHQKIICNKFVKDAVNMLEEILYKNKT